MLTGERIALVCENHATTVERIALQMARAVYGPDNVRVFEGLGRANQVLPRQSPAYVATVYDGSNEDFVDAVFDLPALSSDTRRVLILSDGHLISVVARERFDHDWVMWLPQNASEEAWATAMRKAFGAAPGEIDMSAVLQFETFFDPRAFAVKAIGARNHVRIQKQTLERNRLRMVADRATQIL